MSKTEGKVEININGKDYTYSFSLHTLASNSDSEVMYQLAKAGSTILADKNWEESK